MSSEDRGVQVEARTEVDVVKADARDMPLANDSVDLIVTSPPYFGLRAYEDGGSPMPGQLGQESTPSAFVAALLDVTREMLRVLRPGGSIWVNLNDRYVNRSLASIPARYAIACTDELGLSLRAEVIWSKPNKFIDAKARDRVRRTHETWLHLAPHGAYTADLSPLAERPASAYTDRPQYRRAEELFAAAGLTEAHRQAVRSVGVIDSGGGAVRSGGRWSSESGRLASEVREALGSYYRELCGSGGTKGVVPGSVRSVAAHPFKAPPHLGLSGHFASYPVEWPLWIVAGWSAPGATVLDPFGGTGTTALAASVLGRNAVSVDLSADYCRIAEWRTSDPGQVARARAIASDLRLTQEADR